MNFIQIIHPSNGRRIGLVNGDTIKVLRSYHSTYALFTDIINSDKNLEQAVMDALGEETLDYDLLHAGHSDWTILPPIDVPDEPMRCLISGTGLTHRASAENRNLMHEKESENELTDSMKMYLWGERGGFPIAGHIGVQPEWFYKGHGHLLCGHNEPLLIPSYAEDGGEEPEIVGIYLVNAKGQPVRLGFAQGNEFSDHVMEKKNYLYLAPSKLRRCSIGPELTTNASFNEIPGNVRITRNDRTIWSKNIVSGEQVMAHSLANLEHHHFKYTQHCIPGQLHIHFFGASAFSFGAGVQLQDGDVMRIHFQGMGRPLLNPIQADPSADSLVQVIALSS